MLETHQTRNPFILHIRRREMDAYVSQCCSAQKGVSHGMGKNVSVGVAQKAFLANKFHAAQDKLPPASEAVDVVPEANSHAEPPSRSILSAKHRSAGRVIFMLA